MSPRPIAPTKQPPAGQSVSDGEVLPLGGLRFRFGVGHKTVAKMQKDGLRTVSYGRQKFVLGSDVLQFFRDLAERQAEVPGE